MAMFLAIALLGCQPAPMQVSPELTAADELVGLWQLQVRRESWKPHYVDHLLRIELSDGRLVGAAAVDPVFVGRTTYLLDGLELSEDQVRFTLREDEEREYFYEGVLSGGQFSGQVTWHDGARVQVDSFVASNRIVARFDRAEVDGRLPRAGDPDGNGLPGILIDRMALAAEDSRTDALVILSDGKVVCERYYGRQPGRMSSQSITKAVSGLAVGFLLDEGLISSVDQPLVDWYPEFGSDGRDEITLRHVLTHTSGLDEGSTGKMNRADDRVGYALNARLLSPPGTVENYNNRAMQLLSGVVQRASGAPVEEYLRTRLFEPLGIKGYTWQPDANGQTPTYGGLNIKAMDLAVLGQALSYDGRWNGEQVVPAAWVTEMSRQTELPAGHRGLVWELRTGPDGHVIGYGHSGSGGQYLYVYPQADLVVVRMVRIAGENDYDRSDRTTIQRFGTMADAMALSKLSEESE